MTDLKPFKKTREFTGIIILMSIICCSCSSNKGVPNRNTSHNQQLNKIKMKKVLIIGMDPHTIDFTNPELPVGLTAEKIEQGTKATNATLKESGYDVETFLIKTGNEDLSDLEKYLNIHDFDGIVIGNGIRGIKSNFILFEKIVNVVHTNATKSKIIFNSLPTDTPESVKRWF